MEEKLFFQNNDGLKLCGVLSRPADDIGKCIILCHGITVDKNENGNVFVDLAKNLVEYGYTVFRFDFRGHGESDGNSIDMTVSGERRDLMAAVNFLKSLGYTEFGIVAASFGAGAVLLYLTDNQVIEAIVFWNPIIDYYDLLEPRLPWTMKYFGNKAMKKLEECGYAEVGSRRFKIGEVLLSELKELHPWKILRDIKVPILFVHGDKDSYVSHKDSVKYADLFNAKLETIKGAEHGFSDRKKDLDSAIKATAQFFLDNF